MGGSGVEVGVVVEVGTGVLVSVGGDKVLVLEGAILVGEGVGLGSGVEVRTSVSWINSTCVGVWELQALNAMRNAVSKEYLAACCNAFFIFPSMTLNLLAELYLRYIEDRITEPWVIFYSRNS